MTEEPQEIVQPGPDRGRLVAGVAIIALGVLLFLDHAGVIDWGSRTGWWPIIAIVFGVARLAEGGRGVNSGVFFVLVGAWGLLNEYGALRYEDSWPLLLVIAGGSMVLGSFGPWGPRGPRWSSLSRSERRAARMERHSPSLIWVFLMFGFVFSLQGRFGPRGNWAGNARRNIAQTTETGDTVHRTAILGETRSVSPATEFHGGDLTAIMGHCELDLTQATIAPGETPVVNVFVLMGEVTVRVPKDWIVDTRAVPALGQVKDWRTASDTPAA